MRRVRRSSCTIVLMRGATLPAPIPPTADRLAAAIGGGLCRGRFEAGVPHTADVDVEAAQLFFSLLALLAGGGALVVLVARLSGRRDGVVGQLVELADDAGLWIAATVALTATLGSLYFSEVAHYVPCRLCWFQRIAMYPLAVVLVIAAVRRDRAVRWYAGPLAAARARSCRRTTTSSSGGRRPRAAPAASARPVLISGSASSGS